MKSDDELVVESIKEFQLTVICNDGKEHIISLCDFVNVKDSELFINRPDKSGYREINVKIKCDRYSFNAQ